MCNIQIWLLPISICSGQQEWLPFQDNIYILEILSLLPVFAQLYKEQISSCQITCDPLGHSSFLIQYRCVSFPYPPQESPGEVTASSLPLLTHRTACHFAGKRGKQGSCEPWGKLHPTFHSDMFPRALSLQGAKRPIHQPSVLPPTGMFCLSSFHI